MNNKPPFMPRASGTPADSWKSRPDPFAAAWHRSTRQGGSAWRAALIDSAESIAAQTLRRIEP